MLAVLVGSLALAAPVPKAAKRFPPDPERMQGAWTVVENNGTPDTAGTVWTFADGKMHSSSGDSNWTINLDLDQSPKHLDLVQIGGRTTYRGLYEFDGETLKIAYDTGRGRPAAFTHGNGVQVTVLVRKKEQPDR